MPPKNLNDALAFVRGLSALAVMAGHLRAFIFVDYGNLTNPGVIAKSFYFATGFAHQAVMIFFVLSGYFVGGSVCKNLGLRQFSWPRYAVSRLVRLWIVLVPALILTFVCDGIGKHVMADAYNGSLRHIFQSGPAGGGTNFSLGSFLGNLVFLQTIAVPCFGTNGPLWSLSNEFWYYVLFPLAACGLLGIARPKHNLFGTLVTCFAVIFISWFLPREVIYGGFIWIMGVGVWWISTKDRLRRMAGHPIYFALAGGMFLSSLVATKLHPIQGSDFFIGGTFALWVSSLVGSCQRKGLIRQLGVALSECSYTLYVVHFPIQFLLVTMLFKGRQFTFGLSGMFWFCVLFLASLGAATAMWALFERRTDAVRRWIFKRFPQESKKTNDARSGCLQTGSISLRQ